jgi:type II secretory pathway pseudopilin PulG
MKAASTSKFHRGVSIVEILIALAILTLTISAVIMVVFGNQSLAVDTQTNIEALTKAQSQLEGARALAAQDFYAVKDAPATQDDIYQKSLEVEDRAECLKQATSNITWQQGGRDLSVSITTLFSDLSIALMLGGDCDPTPPAGWDAPKTHSVTDVIHNGSVATDVDVVRRLGQRIAAVTTKRAGNQDTVWMIDVTDETGPVLLASGSQDDKDLLAVDVTQDYVFAASASTTAQLQIFNTLDATFVASAALPDVDPSGSAPEAISIQYVDGLVFIGTKETAGPEFHVFNVSVPTAPVSIGKLELNHNVHDIAVQNGYAYIASSANECELLVIDVRDPGAMTNPCPTPPIPAGNTVFNAAGNFDAVALDVAGTKVYLGRVRAQASEDFIVLNTTDLTAITKYGGENLQINPSTEVVGVEAQWPLVFLATTDQTPNNGGGPLLIYNVQDPANPTSVPSCALQYSEKATGIDFLENIAFISNESNDALAIVYPALSCS